MGSGVAYASGRCPHQPGSLTLDPGLRRRSFEPGPYFAKASAAAKAMADESLDKPIERLAIKKLRQGVSAVWERGKFEKCFFRICRMVTKK